MAVKRVNHGNLGLKSISLVSLALTLNSVLGDLVQRDEIAFWIMRGRQLIASAEFRAVRPRG
jgi:hypothetical protein